MTIEWAIGICLATVFINIGLLGLSLKLYTEYFKDRRISKRGEKP
jgi:hypothetical protein